jgi:hypothetical protein
MSCGNAGNKAGETLKFCPDLVKVILGGQPPMVNNQRLTPVEMADQVVAMIDQQRLGARGLRQCLNCGEMKGEGVSACPHCGKSNLYLGFVEAKFANGQTRVVPLDMVVQADNSSGFLTTTGDRILPLTETTKKVLGITLPQVQYPATQGPMPEDVTDWWSGEINEKKATSYANKLRWEDGVGRERWQRIPRIVETHAEH